MIQFILNNQTIETDQPAGMTVLDFARYHLNLKGTKIGCREGDCGACTVLVGELRGDAVKYRTQTSCLMPLGNAGGKHIVTIEGVNKPDGSLTPVQQAMVDESGTQCGFCTVGFVMSLTGFCLDDAHRTSEAAVSAIDGNICRCTGYKSIERAAQRLCNGNSALQTPLLSEEGWPKAGVVEAAAGDDSTPLNTAINNETVPAYFSGIKDRLSELAANCRPQAADSALIVGGGTDLYVQRHAAMVNAEASHVLYDDSLRTIEQNGEFVEIGASVVVTDLLESPLMNSLFPNLYKHLKLVSSTPIRNMATLAGNFVNASPIGDMTAWFLALDAEIVLSVPPAVTGEKARSSRAIKLRDLYLGYKQLAKSDDEIIARIRFRPAFTHFNFEKVCKRTYLDIASVNTAISLRFSSPSVSAGFAAPDRALPNGLAADTATISAAHVSTGGVAPIPLYLAKTSEFLRGQPVTEAVISEAADIIQTEISPISDVRGSADYKRLLLRQLFKAHFVELFKLEISCR